MSEVRTYLGDGVYASFDGYQIWLHISNDKSFEIRLALEPEVFGELIRYADELRARLRGER